VSEGLSLPGTGHLTGSGVTSTTGRWMILWVQPAIAESKVSGCQHKPSGYISAVTEPDFASAEHPEQSVKCSHTSFSFRSFHFMEKYCHSPSEGLQGPKDSCLLPLDHCCTYSSPIGLCCSGHTLMQGLANIVAVQNSLPSELHFLRVCSVSPFP
jgi:hypothetical protein